jgi:hypothetical protein
MKLAWLLEHQYSAADCQESELHGCRSNLVECSKGNPERTGKSVSRAETQ